MGNLLHDHYLLCVRVCTWRDHANYATDFLCLNLLTKFTRCGVKGSTIPMCSQLTEGSTDIHSLPSYFLYRECDLHKHLSRSSLLTATLSTLKIEVKERENPE